MGTVGERGVPSPRPAACEAWKGTSTPCLPLSPSPGQAGQAGQEAGRDVSLLLGQERKWGTCRRMPWGQAVAPGVLGLRVRMPGLVRPRRTQGNLAGQEELSECRSQTSAPRSWGGGGSWGLPGWSAHFPLASLLWSAGTQEAAHQASRLPACCGGRCSSQGVL